MGDGLEQQTSAIFGCVDLKLTKDGQVVVLEVGDGHTSGFTGSGSSLPGAFLALGYGPRPATPILDAIIENKALTHYAFMDASFGHLRPASAIFKRVYDAGLVDRVLAAVGGGPCVLKLLDRARGCGVVVVGPDDLDDALRTLLIPRQQVPEIAELDAGTPSVNALTTQCVGIADRACRQGYSLEEQSWHWHSDECPFFIAEALCESRLVDGLDGLRYDGTMRVAFALEESGDAKFIGAYWKLPDVSTEKDECDLFRRIVSHTHGGVGTLPCTDEDKAAVWAILQNALPRIFSLDGKHFTISALLERYKSEPLLLVGALTKIAGGLTAHKIDEAEKVLLLAEQLLADENGSLADIANSYVQRTKGTLVARHPAKSPNWIAAEEFFIKSLSLLASSAAAAYFAGVARFSQGSYKDASVLFAKSILHDCDLAAAYSYMATSCLLLKDSIAAVRISEALIQRHCTLAAGYHHLAVSLYAQEAEAGGYRVEQRQRAREALQRARELQRGKSWTVEDDNMMELLQSDATLPRLPVRTWLFHSWRT